ncbi:MAG: ribonuclease P protein component [Planctomycetota bacterium]|nr:ribonuclease P protein component [Planctomycetota bacterium]
MPKHADQSFPPKARMHSKKEFDRVIRKGVQVSDALLRLRVLASEEGRDTRLGITIGRKAGRAVRRNRVRRLIREAFRAIRSELPPGLDIVVFPLTQSRDDPFHLKDVKESLTRLVGKAGRRLEERKPRR